MKKDDYLKLIGALVVIIVIANILLFVLKIFTALLFWIIVILAAIFAFKLLPKLKK